MYLFGTLDPHPPTATPILGQSPKKYGKTVKLAELLFSLKGLGLAEGQDKLIEAEGQVRRSSS